MRQAPAQGEPQPGVPQLPREVLVAHVLPHLGDCALAAAACASRGWRCMTGEVSCCGSSQADDMAKKKALNPTGKQAEAHFADHVGRQSRPVHHNRASYSNASNAGTDACLAAERCPMLNVQ